MRARINNLTPGQKHLGHNLHSPCCASSQLSHHSFKTLHFKYIVYTYVCTAIYTVDTHEFIVLSVLHIRSWHYCLCNFVLCTLLYIHTERTRKQGERERQTSHENFSVYTRLVIRASACTNIRTYYIRTRRIYILHTHFFTVRKCFS